MALNSRVSSDGVIDEGSTAGLVKFFGSVISFVPSGSGTVSG